MLPSGAQVWLCLARMERPDSRPSAARRAAAFAIALALAIAVRGSIAASPDIGLAQFGIDRWDAADGLGSNWVRTLAEDPDGTIWIGTTTGLLRFDGRNFEPVLDGGLAALPQRAINALAIRRDGGLWVGLEHGGVRRVGPGATEPPALADGIVVRDLAEDGSGTLWVATSGGLWRIDDTGAVQVAPAAASDADINTLAIGPGGELWVRSAEHGLWRIEGAAIDVVEDAPECRGFGIAVGPDGERFMSCRNAVWRWPARGRAWQRIGDDFGVGPIHLDRRGDLWYGAEVGLTRWSNGRIERLAPAQGLGDWRVRALVEDRRGDIWIGTFSGGLARLQRGAVRTYGRAEGLAFDGATTVVPAGDGRLWIGAYRRGLFRFDPKNGRLDQWTSRDGLPGETVWTLAVDPRAPGRAWIGTDRGLAIIADGALQDGGPGARALAGAVRVIDVDPVEPGVVWLAGDTAGVVRLDGRRATAFGTADGLPPDRVRFFHWNLRGQLLAGGAGGLHAFDGLRWIALTPGGRSIPALTAIAEHADGSLWLASSRLGLLRVDADRVVDWDLNAGLPLWPIHALSFDRAGGLWMSGNEGLARIRLDDHARWVAGELAQVPVERLGRRDGLRGVETNGWGYPAHALLDAGRLAFPTAEGVAVVDPAALPSVGLSPTEIRVRGAWAGARALPVDAPLGLGRSERTLRIAYSAVELLRPEAVSYRYRLKGVDADWIESGQGGEAGWSLVPPGVHRFLLQARLPGQPWIDAARELEVRVEPQPWESPVLRATALALALLVAVGLVNWRLRLGSRHAAVLGRARAFLREVIDTSPNPMFVRGRDGSYSLANRAAAEIYHRTPDQLEGRTPAELGASPPGMARIDALDAEVIAEGAERILAEHEIVDGEGRRRWFRVVKRPGFGADGRHVEQVIGTAVDVTDFKLVEQRLEREQARLRRSREEARALSGQLLRAQEDERRRLAQEIHDDLAQQLAGLSMLAWSTAQAAARAPGADRREALEHLAQGLERLANDVQALAHELHPPALEALGFVEALRLECATFGTRTGLPIAFRAVPLAAEPPPKVGLALYRIVQEALRNALAHARARHVSVSVEGRVDGLRLEVADDGVGFELGTSGARAGLGLGGMHERARLSGARIEIDSAVGRGTRIVVDWLERPRHRRAPAAGA